MLPNKKSIKTIFIYNSVKNKFLFSFIEKSPRKKDGIQSDSKLKLYDLFMYREVKNLNKTIIRTTYSPCLIICKITLKYISE
ncbi:hypothetical protein CQA53_04245 [Helicobacter didelphidarum]|uniref:Uncharacterized protein n=1 Tax=Helicobacter didelphidarum TaxID=2040648 RepID=A0A3D8ILX1_9HELI|nr:hypothetical protein CQA53_04245 [Helicobacter didelphidarum]